MGLKRHHRRGNIVLFGDLNGFSDDGLVTQMQTIKVTKGGNTPFECFWNVIDVAKEAHSHLHRV